MTPKEKLKLPFSNSPWYTGHLCKEDHVCDCPYIFNEEFLGGLGEVYINNGKKVGEGGNDAPPVEEAKANQRLFAAALRMYELLEDVQKETINESLYFEIEKILNYTNPKRRG